MLGSTDGVFYPLRLCTSLLFFCSGAFLFPLKLARPSDFVYYRVVYFF